MRKVFSSLLAIVLFFACSIGVLSTNGQASSDTTFQFSLKQVMEYAYEHQQDVLNANINASISDEMRKEVIGIGLPQVSASFDLKDYEKIPTVAFPDFSNPGQMTAVQFGTQWNATAGINASQLIFNPTYIVGLQASKSLKELAQKSIVRTKIETSVAVSKAYYNVLVTAEALKLLDANTTRLKKLKDNTQAMFDNGFVEKIDLDRVTLAYNNMATAQQKAIRLAELSKYLLKFQAGMPISSSLTLTDSLNYGVLKDYVVSAEKPDVTKRIEYSMLQTQRRLQELDLKRYKVAYYPTLNAYGYFSQNAFRTEFNLFESSQPWYPTALIGATLSLNIFDGTQREHRIHQANLGLRKIENDLVKAENSLTLEAINARTALQNALDSYNNQKENLDLADRVVVVTRTKYEQGVGGNIEVIEAETALREAQTNYYSALYDIVVAKLDLDKALGNVK